MPVVKGFEASERRRRALLEDDPDSAREADGGCFAAFIGLGAPMDHETHALHHREARLALPKSLPAEHEDVVPD